MGYGNVLTRKWLERNKIACVENIKGGGTSKRLVDEVTVYNVKKIKIGIIFGFVVVLNKISVVNTN